MRENGTCRICGNEGKGQFFVQWVKPTFTDWDKLLPGDIICSDCAFWFEESSLELARITGKEKRQRMRNYSHFVVGGQWTPLSKGDKAKMIELLLGDPFPELAVVADSGQKHIAFRATRNPQGGKAGWVQFEEQRLWVDPPQLKSAIETIENALSTFSKAELASAHYLPHRIIQFGMVEWQQLESELKPMRGSAFFALVIFLAQRTETETNEYDARNSGRPAGNNLAGDRQRVQKPLPPNDLGTVREHGESQCIHEQSGQVRQLSLFETQLPDRRPGHRAG